MDNNNSYDLQSTERESFNGAQRRKHYRNAFARFQDLKRDILTVRYQGGTEREKEKKKEP